MTNAAPPSASTRTSSGARLSLQRKRASRLAAVQALYARYLKEDNVAPAAMVAQITQSWSDSRAYSLPDLPHEAQPEQALLLALVTSALERAAIIEHGIETVILPQWKKSRMSLPLLSTLRIAGAELLAYPRKARGMLVEEYTEITAQLVGDEEIPYAHKAFNLLFDALTDIRP